MILVVDIGNTRTTIALMNSGVVAAMDGAPSPRLAFRKALHLVRTLVGQVPGVSITGAAIASVVPTNTTLVANAIMEACSLEPIVVSCATAALNARYDDPESIGADRVCNAIAAHHLTGGAAIVIDCGTAATIDCVDSNGTFIGGAILPGYRTAINALHQGTALLPDIPLIPPPAALGTSTTENIQSGIILGTTLAIEGLVRRIMMESYAGEAVPIIVTGGHAGIFHSLSALEVRIEPNLVLMGAAIIAEL
jgi:type III pantothenate kinase